MSWDAVTPIITLVGGIVGTLFVQRVQEKRLRERERQKRIIDVEDEALLELQDVLVTMRRQWSDYMSVSVELDGLNTEQAHRTRRDAELPAHEEQDRAVALCSRLDDGDLRDQITHSIYLNTEAWFEPRYSLADDARALTYADEICSKARRSANRRAAEHPGRLVHGDSRDPGPGLGGASI